MNDHKKKYNQLIRTFFVLIVGVLGLSGWLSAQATTSLNGRVSDPSGAAIPGATVTISRADTGFGRTVRTGSHGEYQFLQVPPGTYVLQAKKGGFAVATEKNVTLLVSQPATMNVAMQLAGSSTTVEVQGSVEPLINTTDATLGNAFDQKQVAALPIADRDVTKLLTLQAGVVYTGQAGTTDQLNSANDTRSGAVNGIRSDQSNFTLDGVDVNRQETGLAFSSVLNVPPDSAQEFRVTTATSNADSGHSSGAEVAMVTKSGTNRLHGSAYEYNRNTVFSANDTLLKDSQLSQGLPNKAPKLQRNVYGFTLGAPVKKDRLFFFVNWEGRRDREGVSEVRAIPSATLRQGIISYMGTDSATHAITPDQLKQMDPLGIGPDAAVLKTFQSYPMPNDNSIGDGLNYAGFRFSANEARRFDTEIARLDYNLNSTGTQALFWRGEIQNFNQGGAPQFPGQPPATVNLDGSKGSILGYTWVMSPTVINNARWGFVREAAGTAGASLAPQISFRGLDSPVAFTRTNSHIVPVNNLIDDVTWTKGNHTIQFGANIDLIRDGRISYENSFSGATTNADWVDTSGFAGHGSPLDPQSIGLTPVDPSFYNSYDFPLAAMMGIITEGDGIYNYDRNGTALAQGTPIKRHYAINDYEFYLQDAWKVTPNLTLNYGLRYVMEAPPYETNGMQVTPCQQSGGACTYMSLGDWFDLSRANMLQGASASNAGEISFRLGGPMNGFPGYWNWDKKDFAPRIGVAWAPDFGKGWMSKIFGSKGNVSIRAGYSIMYDHFGAGIVNTFDQNGSFGLSSNISNPAGVITVADAPRYTGISNLPAACADLSQSGCVFGAAPAGGFPQTPPGGAAGFAITWGLDSSLKTPYVHSFNLSWQRQFHNNSSLTLAWVGTVGRRLMMQEDLAMPLDTVDPKSGMDYFAAAKMLSQLAIKGTSAQNVQSIPFWENMFPTLAGEDPSTLGCNANGFTGTATATQVAYSIYSCSTYNETFPLFLLDLPDSVTGAGINVPGHSYPAYRFYHDQYSSLYAWRSIGTSVYNGVQASYQVHLPAGLQSTFNYTYSHAIDEASDASRVGPHRGLSGLIVNSWDPFALRGSADFDLRHQINANWVWDLPFGRGQHFASSAHGLLNEIIGGWEFTGLYRWTTGFPVNVDNGFQWPTNWEIEGNAMLAGPIPARNTSGNGTNMFADPAAAIQSFRPGLPGESGSRNVIRGDGMFEIDSGLFKSFPLGEGRAFRIGWETFNATNTVRYDVQSNEPIIDQSSSFGNYSQVLVQPRFMQFSARLTF